MALALTGQAHTIGRTPHRARRVDEPERFARAAIAAAWCSLVAHDVVQPGHHHALGGALAGWTVMTVAMMGPVVLPAIRHVAESSLRWRRHRAVAEFAAVYLALWVGFGAVALTLASPMRPSGPLVAGGLLVAAAWQVSPQKRRALWNCHRAIPFPPTGLRATLACARFGVVHAFACMGSCWPLMAVMAVAPSPHLPLSAALSAVVLHERRSSRPRHATQQSAACLAGLALLLVTTCF